jgi:hypothetical protein
VRPALERARRALLEDDPSGVLEAYRQRADGDDDGEWVLLLLEAGYGKDAGAHVSRLPEGERAAYASLLRDEPIPPAPSDEEDELDVVFAPPAARAGVPAAALARFQERFGGRTDLYAEQWANRRRTGYRPIREPLTTGALEDHLLGRRTLGQYLLWPDQTVSFAALDLDLDATARAELEATEGPGSPIRHTALREYLLRARQAGRDLGIPLTAEDSGGKGAHLWAFFEPRVSAAAARAAMGAIVERAGSPPTSISLEIFPKQVRPGRKGLSSLIKLPLGVHRGTERPCPLLDESLNPVSDLAAALALTAPVEPTRLRALLGRRLLPLRTARRLETSPAPPLPPPSGPRALAVALRELPSGPEGRARAEQVIDGCGALRELVDRAHRPAGLAPDEARALIYTLGLLGPEPVIAREILQRAQTSLKELHRVRRGLPSPTGCARLRRLAGGCTGCAALDGMGPYKTPVLHALEEEPAPPDHRVRPWLQTETLDADPFEELADAVIRLDARLGCIEQRREGEPES